MIRRFWRAALAAPVAVAGGIALRYALSPALPQGRGAFICFYPAVAAAAWFGGFVGGALAILLSCIAALQLFMVSPPSGSDQGPTWITIVLFAAVNLLLAGLIAALRHQVSRARAEVAARAQAERELRHSETRLAGMIESAFDAIVSADGGQRIVVFNHAAEEVFRVRADAMLGQPIELLLPERLRAGYRAHVAALGQAGTTSRSMAVPGGFFALRPDGEEFPVDAGISQVRTAEGPLYTVLLRDVSERVKAAAQLKDVEAQLVQAQRMEAIGRLAGGVAHDFNNVLTVIIGVVQMLLRDREPDAPDRTDLEEVYQAALRAASLTRQLLAFSRRQALVPQPLDLNAVVEGVTHGMLRRLIGEDVQVVTALAADLGTVQADPGQLTQVVLNLAMNARDAMPNGGRLLVETANVELDSVYADTHLGVAPGPYAMLAVTDTGVGMDDATRLQAFEPFFTTKPAGQGTGLGLSTVYGIVKQSGGGVFVYSEPGRGATFKVYLPRIDRPAPAAAAGKPEATGGRTGTILLVEDESAVRAFAARVLRQEGYDVLETASRDEAVAAVRTRDVRIDLILTDVILAGGANGRDTADAVLALHPGAAVLFMSGYTNDAVLGRGGLDPGAYFLEKPFTIEALCRRVHEVLADHPSGGAGEQRQPA